MRDVHILHLLLTRLNRRLCLSQADKDAVLALPFSKRTAHSPEYLIRQGEQCAAACLIISGFSICQRVARDGERQIFGVRVPGDLVNVDGLFFISPDYNVQTLPNCTVAIIPLSALKELIGRYPQLGHALWRIMLVEAAVYRAWTLNIGTRDARRRIAHLFCELAARMEAAGFEDFDTFQVPLTQKDLADATGLTSIHVNRTLKKLEAERFVVLKNGSVSHMDIDRLRDLANYDDMYLRLG